MNKPYTEETEGTYILSFWPSSLYVWTALLWEASGQNLASEWLWDAPEAGGDRHWLINISGMEEVLEEHLSSAPYSKALCVELH